MQRMLIANRGEIACRIARTARLLDIHTIAVYSDVDKDALHTRLADEAIHIRDLDRNPYLDIDGLIETAEGADADAIHPGYGFLSENAAFARACEKAGITFIGPPASAIEAMGGKMAAKTAVAKLGVPVLPWTTASSIDDLIAVAGRVGFPMMIKASAGGGGRGLRRVEDLEALKRELPRAKSEAERAFADGALMLERALDNARHVEIQILADQHGNIIHLGERDCSLQRRHQKVIEEAPAVDEELREKMGAMAIKVARSVGYVGVGTVEFLLAGRDFYFLEMNTRLQVEHPVTELITDLDLVALQIGVAEGEPLQLSQEDVRFRGHAIEARLYAEDDAFVPQSGRITAWIPPPGVRIDHGIAVGQVVTTDYDAMLAKIIVRGATRGEALERMQNALAQLVIHGVTTNQRFLYQLVMGDVFQQGRATTRTLDETKIETPGPTDPFKCVAAAILAGRPKVGFRTWGWDSSRVRFAIGDEVIEAQVVEVEVQLRENHSGDESVRFENGKVIISGHEKRFVLSRNAERMDLTVEYDTHTVVPLPLLEPKRAKNAAQREVLAPMSGKVISVVAKTGEQVAAGALLVVLEAMKMQHEVRAPQASVVRSVRATQDAQVAAKSVLVELDPQEAP